MFTVPMSDLALAAFVTSTMVVISFLSGRSVEGATLGTVFVVAAAAVLRFQFDLVPLTGRGQQGISHCSSVKMPSLTSRIQTIGRLMFRGLSLLESVNVPSSLSVLDWWAFVNCTSLITVTLEGGI